jgi:hypothetical protein
MLILIKTGLTAALVVLLSFVPSRAIQAAEIDFSCMSYKVWPKSHLSRRYRTYDIVLQNRCPGPVYWAMCIERVNEQHHSVWEKLAPTGYLVADKKARVNLQTKQNEGKSTFRQRYEEFYVNIAYSVDSAVTADCFAAKCEAQKSELRAAVDANEAAWEKAEKAVLAKIAAECPDSGWDTATRQECAVEMRESGALETEQYALKDAELRESMATIDPDRCTAWSGDLITE